MFIGPWFDSIVLNLVNGVVLALDWRVVHKVVSLFLPASEIAITSAFFKVEDLQPLKTELITQMA